MIGKVLWFNSAKGYGFISDEATSKEYFVHYSAIQSDGYKELKPEQRVKFEVEEGKAAGKLQAANVVVIG